MTVIGRDTTERLRDCAAVQGYVERVCFKTGPPGLVGTELEWLVAFADDPGRTVPIPLLRETLDSAGPLPHRSAVTFEPGGQLELSSAVFPGPSACWQALTEDAEHARRALAAAGLVLLPTAIDPHRAPHRQLQHPRYDAMEAYFAAAGPDSAETGPVMMTGTAALQVNLDIGHDLDDACRRWRLLHDLAPVLVATFANSPIHAGRDTGWKSARQQVWQRLDLERTTMPPGPDPASAWTQYALDAHLMLRRRDGDDWRVEHGTTFHDWLVSDDPPTEDDLATHLTTLFPPVRPRGWFEVRYLDAQPWRWWPVPMAVLTALVEDPDASEVAALACRDLDDWTLAARDALAAPGFQEAAAVCFDAALLSMSRSDVHPDLVARVAEFADRYVSVGRCPADDPLPDLQEAL
ncbi:MAG: ergothioneine biosynthesis glutamate--cysteine ligase EgtA [Nocardioidaceae bacterium]|nr:ergothioneine biosynthesis glutamate--cysteine ligase EgtA [Nocardioidaceae bacterium]NUS51501.1 ergothioneine biosynthesis glutamate--cysteine ligase EgtA [Nocardioidaceae bacterium]